MKIIYYCYYGYLCGNYQGVVVASNKDEAARLFQRLDKAIGAPEVNAMGKAYNRERKSRVIVWENNY